MGWGVLGILAVLVLGVLAVVGPVGAKDEGEVGVGGSGEVYFNGCGYSSCLNHPFPRWAMAVWLVTIVDGQTPPQITSSRFMDVSPDEHWASYVERLFELGITKGCGTNPARYCPEDRVTRAQMASFLVRAFNLEVAQSGPFTDIATSGHADDINALVASGLAGGCRTNIPEMFCPHTSPTLGKMRDIMKRAVALNDPGN